MNKICFKKNCQKNPIFTCECKQGVYFCKKHMGDHMMLQKNHQIVSLYAILDDEDQAEFKVKCEKLINVYNKILQQTEEFCKALISSIIQNSKKIIDEIEKYKSTVLRVHSCILRNVPLDNEDLSFINKIEFESDEGIHFEESDIIKFLDSKFEKFIENISSNILQDNFVFYQTLNNQYNFNFFDIEKNKIDTKTIVPDSISYIISVAQYTKDFYYFISSSVPMSQNYAYYNYSTLYIQNFDVNNLNLKTIYTSGSYCAGPLIILDSCLYVFISHANYYTVNAYKYEISNGTFNQISNLPQSLGFISASQKNDKIFFTGNSTPNLYTFDHQKNSFEVLFTIKNGNNKYLHENWVVSFGDSLYEIKNDKLIKYHDLTIDQNQLALNGGFRKGKFIYFVTFDQVIYRIDTQKKVVCNVATS